MGSRTLVLIVLLGVALFPELGFARRAKAPFPTLTLSGSPYAMGKKHGKAFKRQIHYNVRRYLDRLAEQQMTPARALQT